MRRLGNSTVTGSALCRVNPWSPQKRKFVGGAGFRTRGGSRIGRRQRLPLDAARVSLGSISCLGWPARAIRRTRRPSEWASRRGRARLAPPRRRCSPRAFVRPVAGTRLATGCLPARPQSPSRLSTDAPPQLCVRTPLAGKVVRRARGEGLYDPRERAHPVAITAPEIGIGGLAR